MRLAPFQDTFTAVELKRLCEDILGYCVSTMTIRRWADAGLLPHEKDENGYRRFPRAALAELILELKYGQPAPSGWRRTQVRSAVS